ncbi:MAG TPA: hypothetical protein VNH41_07105, partial [Steroidobacteraceae bacterium]|nr:hypothetical protein [Steroidobacteraceae bacterium]
DRAQKVAGALKDVLTQQGLTQKIGSGEHVLVSGWTLLGSMLGVFPVCVWSHKLENGWEARVEARTRNGEVVGAAEAMCTRDEAKWKNRDEYALRSMAQTRATSKALRQPLGFVVTLAGYNETPAEEVPTASTGAAARASSAEPMISSAQNAKIAVLLKELETVQPTRDGQISYVDQLRADFGIKSRKELTMEQASEAIEKLQGWLDAAEIPFG